MTERLIQELESYKKSNEIYWGEKSLPQFAEHFYNLALEDVKEEVDFLKDKCAMINAVELKDFLDILKK